MGHGRVHHSTPLNPSHIQGSAFWGLHCIAGGFHSTSPGSDAWGRQRAATKTHEPSLTSTGEVPALDGVACAGVHPARGLGLIAVEDKERGCQHPGSPFPSPGVTFPDKGMEGSGFSIHQAGAAVTQGEKGGKRDEGAIGKQPSGVPLVPIPD